MNRRGLGKCHRANVSNAQLRAEIVERVSLVKPEHDSGAARVIRAWLEGSG